MTRILLAAATVANLFASPALAQNPAARRAKPADAFAQSPGSINGQRWPGAHYDANGYYIDPNSPGRW